MNITVDLKEYYKNLHDSVIYQIANHTVPIFFETHRNHLMFNGSGVLIRSVNKHFLVTATHVVNLPEIKGLYTLGKDKTMASLATSVDVKRFVDAPAIKRADTTVFELSTEIIDQLDYRLEFLTEDNINLTALVLDKKLNYLPVGIPGYLADDPKRYHENRLSYRGIPTNLSDYKWYKKHKFTPGDHILVDLPKFINDPVTGSKVKMFNPKGISGGGLWLIPKQSHPLSQVPNFLLTGILIEQVLTGHRCMAATNIIKVFEFLKSGFGAIFTKNHTQPFSVIEKPADPPSI